MGGLLDDVPLNQRQQIWSQYDGASELLDKNGQEGADLYQLQKKWLKNRRRTPIGVMAVLPLCIRLF